MLQGLSETQPSRLEPDYSMNQKKKQPGSLLFETKECVLTFRASCRDIVWSVEVIC